MIHDRDGEVHFTYDATGLYEVVVGGVNLIRAGYIIGSCGGPDDPAQNVVSTGSDGRTLKSPGACPGSPFSYRCQRLDSRSLLIDVSIGPLAAPHQFMSVPMDMIPERVLTFAFVHEGYLVGCGDSWTPRSGRGGRFTDIPQPCVIPIPPPNRVGVARPNRLEPYMEVGAPGVAVLRRTLLAAGALQEGTYTNHPHTHCLDWSWVRGWPGDRRLPPGSVLTMREQITVTPEGAPPPPPAPTFTTPLHVTALTTKSVEIEWVAPGTTASLKGWREADPAGALVLASVVSPWGFTGLAPATRYLIAITVRHAGGSAIQTVVFTTPTDQTPPPTPPPGGTTMIRIDVPAQSVTIDATKVSELALKVTVSPVGDTPPPIPPPTQARAPMPLGVSNVATMDAEEAEMVLAAGCTMVQAEGIPFDNEKPGGQGVDAWDIERLVGIAEVVRRYPDSIFFMTIVNANGAQQMAQTTTWFRDRLNEVLDRCLPLLGSRLWIEGVSEPGSSGKSEEWCRVTRDMVAVTEATLVGNGPGGRGTPAYGGIVDWHYCDQNDLRASVNAQRDRLHSTDCTPCLASNLSETFVRAVTAEALVGRQRLIWYDTDNAPETNREVLRWVQDEIQGNAPAPPPTGDPYLRWPNTGRVTSAQISGIYRELLNRAPDAGGLAYYLNKGMTPACTWCDIRNSVEYARSHPGAGPYPPPPGGCAGGGVTPPPPATSADDIDMAQVVWVRDWEDKVANWPVTKRLDDLRLSQDAWFSFDSNALDVGGWPSPGGGETGTPANYVGFVQVNGIWYAGTWEWAPYGRDRVRMDHGNLAWHVGGGDGGNKPGEIIVRNNPPRSGDQVGLMIATQCRNPSVETVNERTPIRLVRMP